MTIDARITRRAIALLLILAAVLSLCSFSRALTLTETDKEFAKKFLSILNAERTRQGLSPVTLDFKLCLPAKQRATESLNNDMSSAATAHQRPNGTTFGTVFDEFGITGYSRALENLVFTNDTVLSAQSFFDAWMSSTTGHREAMLDKDITVIGIGYFLSGPGVTVAGRAYPEGCMFSCLLMTCGYSAQDPYVPYGSATPTPTPSPSPSPSVTPSGSPDASQSPGASDTPYLWGTPTPPGTPSPSITPSPSPTTEPTPTKRPTPTPEVWGTSAPWQTVSPWEWFTLERPGVVEHDDEYWEHYWLSDDKPKIDAGKATFPTFYFYGSESYKGHAPDAQFYMNKNKVYEVTK